MTDNKRIHFIPPLPPKREKRVGIYCRVSTNSSEQLKSLTAQVSTLTRLTAANPKWLLVDVYIEIASSKTGSSRKEFARLLQDCKSRDIEIVLTKSISRFGRDSKLYNRKCYGYTNADDGSLIIEEPKAKNVRLIFNLYLRGKSIIGIVLELERLGIKSPTGKATWPKRTIDVMLSNEKYIGNVRLLDNGKHNSYYRAENNNPAIISKETFQAVQIEKQHRSNVTEGEEGSMRKSKKYSSKK